MKRIVTALLLVLLGCTSAPPPEGPSVRPAPAPVESAGFTVLQINDTYKIEGLEAGQVGGLPRVRSLRQQLEAEGRPVLLLHGGDILFPSVASKYLEARPVIAVMNLLDGAEAFDPYFFATFGNHEFDHPDPRLLLDRLGESRFGWVSSNVRFRAAPDEPFALLADRFPHVHETVLLELGGIRVGIFGLTLDDQPRDWLAYDYTTEARHAIARAAIARLRAEGAEFLIALTHQELAADELLVREFPEIDWVVGGHEHAFVVRQVGGTWITKADADAKSAVRIDVGRHEGRVEARWAKIDLVGQRVPPDPRLAGEVAKWLVRLADQVEATTGRHLLEVVATTEHALEGVEPALRGRETALGNFLTDVLRERLATDIGLLNGGAIRVNDDVPAGGDLRIYELEGIFYYDNVPVAFEVTGAELLDLLRRSVAGAAYAHGRFLQVSGLRFRYHALQSAAGETVRVEADEVEVRDGGSGRFVPLELDRTYSVASLDYLWKYGFRDGYPLFSAGAGGSSPPRFTRPELSWRGITEEAIAALPERRITTKIDGRIVRVEADAPRGAGGGFP